MKYPQEFLERLRQTARLSSVIGARLPVRRNGREFSALCPFHKEKTPSFTINDEKAFYHCFGCGAHGDAINFIKEYENLGYKEAIEKLAGECGLALPVLSAETQAQEVRKRGLQEINELACQWFVAQMETMQGEPARNYLTERGVSETMQARFRLGFAPADRQALRRYLREHQVSDAEAVAAGLLIQVEGQEPYSRFRGRLMFPIRDVTAKVIAFGGRLLVADDKAPKYLNSPETALFNKSEQLYNLDAARRAAKDGQPFLIAEGYMDVVMLTQYGLEAAVAPLGTAVSAAQLQLLWRYAAEPVFCLDGDAAGLRAMQRSASLALPMLEPGRSVRFCLLPGKEDPDSFLRRYGKQDFLRQIDKAKPLAALLSEPVLAQPVATPDQRAAQEQQLMRIAEQIRHPVVKAHYRQFFKDALWQAHRPALTKKREGAMAGKMRTKPVETSPVFPPLPDAGDIASQKEQAASECLYWLWLEPALLLRSDLPEIIAGFDWQQPAPSRLCATMLRATEQNHIDHWPDEVNTAAAQMGWASRPAAEDQAISPHQRFDIALFHYRHCCVRSEYQALADEFSTHLDEAHLSRLTATKAILEEMEQEYQRLQMLWLDNAQAG